MALSRDDLQSLADQHYDSDALDSPDMRSFAMLVDLCSHVYEQYLDNARADMDDPDSFKDTGMLGGVSIGWGLLEGLKENMEIKYPDGEFRRMLGKYDPEGEQE